MTTNAKYCSEQLLPLIGGTIEEIATTHDRESFGLVIKKSGTLYMCWVDCDAEGNGSGWMIPEVMGDE